MTNDRGIEHPATFTTSADEYAAVCERTGLIDLSFRTQLQLTGTDTVDFLQGMISNDVKALQPGQGRAAALLTEQGRLVADLRVYATESAVLLDVDARIAAKTTAALERFIIADDVEIADLAAQQTTIAVQGPEAGNALNARGLDSLPEHDLHHCEAPLDGVAVRIVRADQTGHGGYEIHAPSDRDADVWRALASVDGVQPVGHTALNMLRIEAGIPWYGVDMDEDRVVLEVGLEHAISFQKGCYLGQEVVERVSARGHVNRRLCGLLLSDVGPTAGARLLKDGKDVGWLTSVAESPRLGRMIGLGYVRREHADPDTKLSVGDAGQSTSAEVATLPFL